MSPRPPAEPDNPQPSSRSLRALEWGNFFLADVQTGLGPYLAAYLVTAHWNPSAALYVLTFGGLVTVLLQTPAGAVVDQFHRKRMLVVVAALVLGSGAVLLALSTTKTAVYSAQVLIGSMVPFLVPALAAITMGLVGQRGFDRQFGRNQSFNSAGNVMAALLTLAVSRVWGNRAIFFAGAVLILPTILSVLLIRPEEIDYDRARGGRSRAEESQGLRPVLRLLAHDRVLLLFLPCCFLFHFANAAMLPELGELLSGKQPKTAVAFMTGCILVTQVMISLTAAWIGGLAGRYGRRPLLLIGFGVLPVRAVLYTLTHVPALLIGIQALDGVANAIFGVVSILVISDRTHGTGRFNLASGALATAVGAGAALSNSYGGFLIYAVGFRGSFLGLGGVALVAFALLYLLLPETARSEAKKEAALQPEPSESPA